MSDNICMNIAIIGTGYGGLSAGWFLCRAGYQVTFFSSKPIGGGASGASAGLLHPFPGRNARKAWSADAALSTALDLMTAVAHNNDIYRELPFFRIPKDKDQELQFQRCVTDYPEASWEEHPPILKAKRAMVVSARVVYPRPYLELLGQSCFQQGAQHQITSITDLAALSDYDLVIIAAGAGTLNLLPQCDLRPVKGQALHLRLPKEVELPFALSQGKYLVPGEKNGEVIVGATFERGPYLSLKEVREQLLTPLKPLFPPLNNAEEIGYSSGIRISTKNRLPIAQKIDHRTYVLTGFGSRGLLYHAFFAKKLSDLVQNHLI